MASTSGCLPASLSYTLTLTNLPTPSQEDSHSSYPFNKAVSTCSKLLKWTAPPSPPFNSQLPNSAFRTTPSLHCLPGALALLPSPTSWARGPPPPFALEQAVSARSLPSRCRSLRRGRFQTVSPTAWKAMWRHPLPSGAPGGAGRRIEHAGVRVGRDRLGMRVWYGKQ